SYFIINGSRFRRNEVNARAPPGRCNVHSSRGIDNNRCGIKSVAAEFTRINSVYNLAPGSSRRMRRFRSDNMVCAGYQDEICVVLHASTMTFAPLHVLEPVIQAVDNSPHFYLDSDASSILCG